MAEPTSNNNLETTSVSTAEVLNSAGQEHLSEQFIAAQEKYEAAKAKWKQVNAGNLSKHYKYRQKIKREFYQQTAKLTVLSRKVKMNEDQIAELSASKEPRGDPSLTQLQGDSCEQGDSSAVQTPLQQAVTGSVSKRAYQKRVPQTPIRRSARVPLNLDQVDPSPSSVSMDHERQRSPRLPNNKAWQLALVTEIEKRPVIWDRRLAEHRDLPLRNTLWQEVALMFNSSIPEIRKKWDQLVRRFRAIRSDLVRRFPVCEDLEQVSEEKLDEFMLSLMPFHPWPLFKKLIFMHPVLYMWKQGDVDDLDNVSPVQQSASDDMNGSPPVEPTNKNDQAVSLPALKHRLLARRGYTKRRGGTRKALTYRKIRRPDDRMPIRQADCAENRRSEDGLDNRRRGRGIDDLCRTFGLHIGDLASFVPSHLLSQYMNVVTAGMYSFMDSKVPQVKF